jgi:hypothetical protein
MLDSEKRLFVGIKVSNKLQTGLDSPAPGTELYFKQDNKDYLQVINLGEEKLIGRFLKDGFPVDEIENVSRNVRSIVRLITRGQRLDDDAVHIYVR